MKLRPAKWGSKVKLRCGILELPMAATGHSRRGRLLPAAGRLPQCPESGRKVRALAPDAMGQ
jgi:hypothetical protein